MSKTAEKEMEAMLNILKLVDKSLEEANQDELCKHEHTEKDGCITVCLECGEILPERELCFDYNSLSRYKKQNTVHHCTKKYFEKLLNKLSITDNYYDLVCVFEEQEHVLKQVLEHERRKNSLNVHYKLYKLSQRLGIDLNNNIKLPKGYSVLKEHDRIMKRVWNELKWDWIET